MLQVQDIEKAIKKLPEKDFKRFRQWFAAFDAEMWDSQIEADSFSGRLDSLANTAVAEHKNKTTKEL